MKPFAVSTVCLALFLCAALGLDGGEPGVPSKTPAPSSVTGNPAAQALDDQATSAPLIVHEWGTFTSFSGSDGVKLEFRPLLENDLPAFVYNRAGRSAIPFYAGKPSITALQRMETPVTYFYTPIERDVSVKVEFPEGLLTEFFPPVRSVSPAAEDEDWFTTARQSSISTAQPLKNSSLDWGQVHLIPTTSLRARVANEELSRRIGRHVEDSLVPAAGRHFIHYTAARETDSAIVQTRKQADGTIGGPMTPESTDYFEKFLFYRGVGNFDLPLTLSETDDGTFGLANAGQEEIRSLFLVTVEGESVRFKRFDRIVAADHMTLAQATDPSSIDDLAESMVTSLVAEGLYENEARAMLKCWKSSWFGEEGTRLLYLVPAALTNGLLPLHVKPRPDEVVRVLVGRMEIMPSSQEGRVLQLVQQSADARQSVDKEKSQQFQSPSLDALLAMGRLAEPALVRARNITAEEGLRNEANLLIRDLHAATQ